MQFNDFVLYINCFRYVSYTKSKNGRFKKRKKYKDA